jgi:hypothetical protein
MKTPTEPCPNCGAAPPTYEYVPMRIGGKGSNKPGYFRCLACGCCVETGVYGNIVRSTA